MGKARIKSPNKHYHIHGHVIPELRLFRDDFDKLFFINLLNVKSEKYNFTVHAFALMDTHYHFSGKDNDDNISVMMQSILTSYAMYYNKRYHRKGHVFMERFRSRPIVDSYDLVNLTKYIHNNPCAIEGFRNTQETYPFSSISKYVGEATDLNQFVDITCVMDIVYTTDIKSFHKSYLKYIKLKE